MTDYYFPLFLVCCLGHALIWVRAINWMHGIQSQAVWTDLVRLVLHFILSGLPLLWFCLIGFDMKEPFWHDWPQPWAWFLTGYLWLIGCLGIVGFPIVWLLYALRPMPKGCKVISREAYNVGKALGRKPYGTGLRGWKAKLPGNQAFEVELVDLELALPRLPVALDGLRILHLSDLHFCGRPGRAYFERVFHYCSRRECDVMVITGDLVDSDEHYHWLKLLQMLPPVPRWAILGNHDLLYDAEKIRNMMRELGYRIFSSVAEPVDIRGESILLAGNEALWNPALPDLQPFAQDERFRLALIHSPDQFHWAVKHRFDLVLAGHNHGGQIRLPGFGSIFVPSKSGRRYDMGLHQQAGTLMHVSKGLSGGHPVRYFCRPEVTWLTLRRM